MCGYGNITFVGRRERKRGRIDHDYPTTDYGNSGPRAEATHFTPVRQANRINNPAALSTRESTRRIHLTCDLLGELSSNFHIARPLAARKRAAALREVRRGGFKQHGNENNGEDGDVKSALF